MGDTTIISLYTLHTFHVPPAIMNYTELCIKMIASYADVYVVSESMISLSHNQIRAVT